MGYGKTTGDKNWVEKQTSITAQDKLDLRTGNHTQLDGALIASDTGNLKLDTNTLGFSDIAGKDKEHGYYLNVGGSYGVGKDTTQDPSQVGKGDNQKDGWSVEGWNYNKDRQQIVRGTVGAGEVVVRADRDGQDSTTGLNRDVDRAYEVTKDDERRTDLYVTKSSVDAVRHTPATVKEWARQVKNYDETAKQNYEQASRNLTRAMNKLESSLGRKLDTQTTQRMGDDFAENTLDGLLQAGLSPRQAKELMADHDFQKTVVEELANLSGIDVGPLRELTELTPGVIELAESLVTPENSEPLTISQETLRSVVELNKYVQTHPQQEETIGVLIAVTQGPKGLAQMAVRKAVDQTPYGERFNEWVEKLNEKLGKMLADYIENKDLDKDLEFDNELIGGGKFMTSVLTGALPGRKGGGERRAVSVESGHKGAGQGGSEKGTGAEGTKGIPSISRSTEITELFSSSSTRSGIQIGNRSLIEVPNTGNAKIFSGATDVEVKQYFSQLTGSTQLPPPRSIPGKWDIYVVNTPEGNFTLRNFSSSSGQTGPAWTTDVPKAAAGTTYNPEIKFLIGNY
nr:adhesin [Pseudomonas cremoricolorata]